MGPRCLARAAGRRPLGRSAASVSGVPEGLWPVMTHLVFAHARAGDVDPACTTALRRPRLASGLGRRVSAPCSAGSTQTCKLVRRTMRGG